MRNILTLSLSFIKEHCTNFQHDARVTRAARTLTTTCPQNVSATGAEALVMGPTEAIMHLKAVHATIFSQIPPQKPQRTANTSYVGNPSAVAHFRVRHFSCPHTAMAPIALFLLYILILCSSHRNQHTMSATIIHVNVHDTEHRYSSDFGPCRRLYDLIAVKSIQDTMKSHFTSEKWILMARFLEVEEVQLTRNQIRDHCS